MGNVSRRSALTVAEEAATLAHADPAAAMRLANESLALDGTDADVRACATWAIGLAHRELGSLEEANDCFASATAVAERAGLRRRAARIRLSWSLVRVYVGDTDGALAMLQLARPDLDGAEVGHCDVQRSLIMTRLGRLDDALVDGLQALPVLRRHGDRLAEGRLLSNLGALRVYRGEFAAALDELAQAAKIAVELGQSLLLARTVHNEAFVHGRRGDVPRSLAAYDDAEAAYRQLEDPEPYLAVLDADRAEVLLGAGLAGEATERAEASLALLERAENVTDRAEVSLLVARCRLAADDRAAATVAAETAARLFSAQRRDSWALLADHVSVEAAAGDDASVALRAEQVADDLDASGWASEARRARLLAARTLLRGPQPERARPLLEDVARRRRAMTAADRTLSWQATSLVRLVDGDRGGARRAAAAGLRVVDDHRATLGASDLRAHAAAAGVDLARIGLRLAIDDGRPREALRWMEAARAVSVLVPPARPPDDADLAAELAQLRAAEAERATTGDPARAEALAARVRSLEAAVARRTRRVSGADRAGGFRVRDVLDALGDRALLEYAMLDGELFGLLAAGGRTSLTSLGPVAPLEREVSSVVFSLQRLARAGASEASLAAARASLDHSLSILGDVLVGPFRRRLGDRRVVVIPSASIRRLPWGSLPGLAGRPASVAPSAAVWLRASSVATPGKLGGSVLIAAGPGLPGAAREAREVGAVHDRPVVLDARRASARTVLDRISEGVALAHVAAHGTFRADNPLFSSLALADGPLTVHELATLARCPAWFVLSACDAAAHTSPVGDEILGLGAGLLSIGAGNLVAPVTAVSDVATRPLMVALHRRLLGGATPAEAMAGLSAVPVAEPAARAAQVAFGVLGA